MHFCLWGLKGVMQKQQYQLITTIHVKILNVLSFVCYVVHSFSAAAATKPVIQSLTSSPIPLKNNLKQEEGGKAEDSSVSSDQLVPDYAAGQVTGPRYFYVKQHHLWDHYFFELVQNTWKLCLFSLILFCLQDETKIVPDGRSQPLAVPTDNGEWSCAKWFCFQALEQFLIRTNHQTGCSLVMENAS